MNIHRDGSGAPIHIQGVRTGGDSYYTPDDVATKLVKYLPVAKHDLILEPHAGGGAFCRALVPTEAQIVAQDIDPSAPAIAKPGRWMGTIGDFLSSTYVIPPKWIIGNPPYTDANMHIEHACTVTGQHVVFLLRLAILSSRKRKPLWDAYPPRKVWVLSGRPSFTNDGGTDRYDYAWIWWDRKHHGPTELGWIP